MHFNTSTGKNTIWEYIYTAYMKLKERDYMNFNFLDQEINIKNLYI